MSPQLRCQLLEAHCKPELCKQFYHHAQFSESETKIWLHRWAVWEQVESICSSLLSKILSEILATVPDSRIEFSTECSKASLMLDIEDDFVEYQV